MAERQDIEAIYSSMDTVFRLSLGDTADYSGALYGGDFSLSLEEAQRAKHRLIVESLGLQPGMRVLDLGCGWGGFLAYLRERGIAGVGVTLSSRQAAACRSHDLEVYEADCREILPGEFGAFDGLVSLGAFEHFCSVEEWRAGLQEQRYGRFFEHAHALVRPRGRFFLQTMVFGRNMIDHDRIDIRAEHRSDARILALMQVSNPGSWLPREVDQVVRTASPYFTVVSMENGRIDYIRTLSEWYKRFRQFGLRKYLIYLSLAARLPFDRSVRLRLSAFLAEPNRVCFERELLDHFRLVFERISPSGP